MGSQWWCLRRSTVLAILKLLNDNPTISQFYRRTWVPDELFFQTLVANLAPQQELSSKSLTRYTFNSWGIPRVYYDDDFPELLAEDKYFIRKVSHRATELRRKLSEIATMPVNSFKRMLNKSIIERDNYISKLELNRHLNCNRWHSLDSFKENPYDFIKSIPNRIIIICSLNSIIQTQASEQLDRLDKTVICGDPFKINGSKSTLMQYKWHLTLGDICFNSPGKVVVISLNVESLQYLDVLRWKTDLHVILVDDSNNNIKQDTTLLMHDLYFKSKILYLLEDRHCELTRLSLNELKEAIDINIHKSSQLAHTRKTISHYRENSQWPSLLKQGHDHYDLIKSIDCKVIIFVCTEAIVQSLQNYIETYFQSHLFKDLFTAIQPDDKSLDWHYFFADLAHISASKSPYNIFFLHLGPQDLHLLETLRWKSELLVMEIPFENPMLFNLRNNFCFNIEGTINIADPIANYYQNVKTIIENRNCQYIQSISDDIDDIRDYIFDFIGYHEITIKTVTDSRSSRSTAMSLKQKHSGKRIYAL
jgi:hypothetical protein